MKIIKKILQNSSVRLFVWLMICSGIYVSVVNLSTKAAQEVQSRKSPTAAKFEKDPEAWLSRPAEISDFRKALDNNEIAAVGMRDSLLLYTTRTGENRSTVVPGCTQLSCSGTIIDRLADLSSKNGFSVAKIEVDPRPPSRKALDALMQIPPALLSLAPMLIILYFYISSQQGGDKRAARLTEKPTVKFSDVIGADEAKGSMRRVEAFMRDASRYVELGATPPRGLLLVGPPGTGKTLLAKALAGECGANFISIDGSYFTSMFYGMGVRKVKQVFEAARRAAPCVIFIDELDGVGRRTSGRDNSGGESEQNRIINRILVEMDGFLSRESIVIVGATNHAENIDPAMRRSGRFDSVIHLGLPTLPDRKELFNLYLKNIKTHGEVDIETLGKMTQGMSPADIANTVNKAASRAAEAGAQTVSSEHLLQAVEDHQLGGEVSSVKKLITPETRERVAIHESGHAIASHLMGLGSVDRISIEPRGPALGVTYVSRETEEPIYGERELRSKLVMLLAGREAELLMLGNVSSGASDDLRRATELAFSMVGDLGFSQTFGLLSVQGVPANLVGPDVQAGLMVEARKLLEAAQQECAQMLLVHRPYLESLTELLLERENLSGSLLKSSLPPSPAMREKFHTIPAIAGGGVVD